MATSLGTAEIVCSDKDTAKILSRALLIKAEPLPLAERTFLISVYTCEGEALRESTLPCPRPEREGIGNYHVFTVPKPVDSRQGQRFLSVTKGIMSTEEGGYSKPDLTGGGRA